MKNILFIDDDEIRTRSLREGLPLVGEFQVIHERTPHKALFYAEKNLGNIDLIIVDVMMPHYDIPQYVDFAIPGHFEDNRRGLYTGLAVVMELGELIQGSEHSVPIVVLTALEESKVLLNAMAEHNMLSVSPTKVLVKPTVLPDFIREVKDALGL